MSRPDGLSLGHLWRFGPPVALMGLIFFLSAQEDLTSGLGPFDLIGRKLVHATEYGVLWFLLLRAFGFRQPLLAALIASAYAATDEYHQTFVEGRHGTPVDWAIDTTGVVVAWVLWKRWWRKEVVPGTGERQRPH